MNEPDAQTSETKPRTWVRTEGAKNADVAQRRDSRGEREGEFEIVVT